MSVAVQRKVQRAVHLIAAVPLFAYVYGSDSEVLQLVVRAAIIPLIALTGIVMWQGPRIRRLRKRAGTQRSSTPGARDATV